MTAVDQARSIEARGRTPWASRVLAGLALLLTLAGTTYAYRFFATAGFIAKRLPDRAYTDKLATAFLKGQLYILDRPSRELLAQANPYDFRTSAKLWKIWDASLYEGRYYFYWGPVPALIAGGVKLAYGSHVFVGDRQIVAGFAIARFLVAAAIVVLALRWVWPQLSAWHAVPAVALLGFANPHPYLLGRPSVYEAAIVSSQCFLLLGLLAALVAVWRSGEGRGGLASLAAAGTFWALAVGCRTSVLLAIGALVVVTAVAASSGATRALRSIAVRFAVLGAPIAAALLLLGLYNYARFGSFFDFGTKYMLTKQQFSPQASFVLPNLYSYLLRRFTLSCQFPFLGAPFFAVKLTPPWVMQASNWIPQEPVVGLLVAIPGLVFAPVALVDAARRGMQRIGSPSDEARRTRLLLWLVTSCALVWLLAAAPTLGVWTATMRYEADVASAALILALAGFWSALVACNARRARVAAHALRAAGVLLFMYSLAVGLALGFQGGYYRAIRALNPELHAKLVSEYSFCAPGDDPARDLLAPAEIK